MRRTRQLQIPRCIVNTVSKKKKLLSPDKIYTCSNYTRIEASGIFSFVEIIRVGHAFLHQWPFVARRYSCIYMRNKWLTISR